MRALGQDLDLLVAGTRLSGAFAQEAVEVGDAAGFGEYALDERQRLGVKGNGRQRLTHGHHRVVDIARLMPPTRDLVVQPGRPVGAIRAGPIGIGVHRCQGFERLVVAGIKSDYFAQLLRRLRQIANPLGQNPPQSKHQPYASLGIGGSR